MDVNGLAGSLELYLGADVLADDSGEPMPIQWTGYSRALGRYQGELLDKRAVQSRFDLKMSRALERGDVGEDEDWSGLNAIFDAMVAHLRRDPTNERRPEPIGQ